MKTTYKDGIVIEMFERVPRKPKPKEPDPAEEAEIKEPVEVPDCVAV